MDDLIRAAASRLVMLVVALAGLAAWAGTSHAQQPTQAQVNAIRQACRTDYQTWMERDAGANTPAGQLAYPDVDVVTGITTLRFWPPATASGPIANLKITVAGYLPALSNSNPTNALLRDAPDLYLFGALAESAPYLQHDERVPVWEARLSAGVKALRVSTERRLYGGAPRRREFARVFG